jgi:hypothetical protein
VYRVNLTVTDALGRADAAPQRNVTVIAPPAPTVVVTATPAAPYTASVNVTFTAVVTNGLGPFSYQWTSALLLPAGATYVGPSNTASVVIRFTQGTLLPATIGVLVTELGPPERSAIDTVTITVAAPPPPPTTAPPPTSGTG